MRFAVGCPHPPVGMEIGRGTVENQAVIKLHRDLAAMAGIDDLADQVSSFQALVLPADHCRVVEKPHM